MNEQQRDNILLQVSSSIASIDGAIEYLREQSDDNARKVDAIRDTLSSVVHKTAEHSTKIISLEKEIANHGEWRLKITGVYLGLITVISLLSVLVNVLRR